MSLPQIALVGKPNVGKSSLFNRIGRRKSALVDDMPGVTRDLLYETLSLPTGGHALLIDSPGYSDSAEELAQLMSARSQAAWRDADLVLFVCDGESELDSRDTLVIEALHKIKGTKNKSVFVLANKIDHGDASASTECYRFGFPVFHVSAKSGFGLKSLMEAMAENLSEKLAQSTPPPSKEGEVRLTLLGKPNVGKSSLFNCIFGEERQLVHHVPGSTRDSVHLSLKYRDTFLRLSDTAGIRRKNKVDEGLERSTVVSSLSAAAESDIIIFLLDASEKISAQDLRLLYLIQKFGKALVVAINKCDLLTKEALKEFQLDLEHQLQFLDYAAKLYISAKEKKGLKALIGSALNAHAAASTQWEKRDLNTILERAISEQEPPLRGRFRPRLQYIHQVDVRPPHLMIHGKRLNTLPDSYIRYLNNFFHRKLKLSGCPLKLTFKMDKNPYGS